jgi:hypothetical protein
MVQRERHSALGTVRQVKRIQSECGRDRPGAGCVQTPTDSVRRSRRAADKLDADWLTPRNLVLLVE